MSGEALAQAARALVGVRFRPDGRDPATGLDCLGVLSAALAAIGHSAQLPARNTLRRRGEPDAEAIARAAGLILTEGIIVPGDVVLVRCSPTQPHVLLAVSADRFVHAHAGLRRVVLGLAEPGWTHIGHWRLPPPA